MPGSNSSCLSSHGEAGHYQVCILPSPIHDVEPVVTSQGVVTEKDNLNLSRVDTGCLPCAQDAHGMQHTWQAAWI